MASTHLPVQLTSFIGRERELAEVRRLLSTARLVTLTGAGGCGKTRLAIQIANTVNEAFEDGVWLVDLAPLREPALVPQLVAQTLGLRPAPNQPLLEAMLSFVRPRKLLLILDNCEHLSQACAQLTQQLLPRSPELRILATSREPLAIAGERIYPLSGLAWPSFDSETAHDRQNSLDPEDFLQYNAVRLFAERARAVSPDFTLTLENASAIAEICRRLDGLPLAIELASARANVLTAEQIAARLDDLFALLTSGQRTGLDPRHYTLRAAIDWSYALLASEEQLLLRRLAVFEAGCTLDTAEAVCSGDGVATGRTLDLLSSLVAKSLVIAETMGRAQARYRLLETIREYALEKLDESGEAARLRDRHLDLFLARAEEAAPKLSGAYQQLWLNWLGGEQDNLRAALAWALESGRVEAGLRLAVALIVFWRLRSYAQEIRSWFERLLAQADEDIPLILRARAATYASYAAARLDDPAGAAAHAQGAVALSEAAGEAGKPLLANALVGLAMSAGAEGDHAAGYRICERTASLYRQLGDWSGLCLALMGQAVEATALGKYEIARALLDESLSLAQEAGDAYRLPLVFNALGDLERCRQNYGRAQAAYERSLAGLRELGAPGDEAAVLHNLAHAHLHQGHLNQAHTLFCESMALQQKQGNAQGLAECLIGFGAMASVGRMPTQAARLLAAAVTLGGKALLVQWPAECMEYDHYLAAIQAQLTDQEFEAAQKEGRTLTMEQAIEYALSLPLVPETTAAEAQEDYGGLTRRERQVAALIGQGKSNGEIAAELVVAKRTVETHVAKIRSKLAVTSRAQIVRWAIEHELTQTSA